MDAKDVVAALNALAHETRLAAFRLLVEAGPDGLPAGSLSERLAMPPSTLTFHLQQLAHAGLVTQRRASRQIIYATDFDTMNTVMGYLTENCCAGSGTAVCAPKAVACGTATQQAVQA
jgi:DNA-binding transcriptional ArsR family regulator